MKKIIQNLIITIFLICLLVPARSQTGKQETEMKREITLYNPYKPSLPDVRKRSFMPDMNDTSGIVIIPKYDINPNKFSPDYTISPIRPAALLPDPLPKLYKSYVNAGLGTYTTPLLEVSITNERSRKGAAGFYGRHYSSLGKVLLQNNEWAHAGLMDNEASLFGKRFFRDNFIEGSVDFTQNYRYAYGYKPEITGYSPSRNEIRIPYNNIGADLSFAYLNLDSTSFSYDFDVSWDFFASTKYFTQHHGSVSGIMSKLYRGFYAGAGISYDHFRLSDTIMFRPKFVFSANPFVSRNTPQYNFRLGARITVERNMTISSRLHLYPDVNFGFSIVPEYISFFAALGGRLEMNDPLRAIRINPYLVPDGSLFMLPNTDHSLVISAGLKGNNGIGGKYSLSVSYSLINDLLLFSNIVYPDTASSIQRGNYFIALPDEAEILNVHGEMNGNITEKLTYFVSANYNKYTLSANRYAWNKPSWDGKLGVSYNLRNKIVAGAELTLLGKRWQMVSESPTGWMTLEPVLIERPVHANLNLSAEYRYTKALSFWARINNISYSRYLEWAYYPTQRFLILAGFTYSF